MVSIVIPVYNDPEGIANTLESLLAQTTDDFGIVVVDNASNDHTPSVVSKCDDDRVSLYHELDLQSSYAARNTAIRHTSSEIYAFIDADMTVPEGWVKSAVHTFQSTEADYMGCNVELTLPEDTLVGRYNVRTGFPVKQYLEQEHYAPTCALFVRREVFEDVGLFDSRLISGGDREFGERVHEAGYEQGYAEEAVVYHPARTRFKSLAKKNFRVGRGFCQKQRYYPDRYGKPGIPPRPSGPSGDTNEEEPDTLTTRFAFAFLSIAMLVCRGLGYYYEFLFGERRDDIPAPTC